MKAEIVWKLQFHFLFERKKRREKSIFLTFTKGFLNCFLIVVVRKLEQKSLNIKLFLFNFILFYKSSFYAYFNEFISIHKNGLNGEKKICRDFLLVLQHKQTFYCKFAKKYKNHLTLIWTEYNSVKFESENGTFIHGQLFSTLFSLSTY